MGRKFSDIAEESRAGWSDEARSVNTAARQVFSAEINQRAEFGAEIARLRRAKELTQPELQALSGVQQAEISRIESGASNPTFSTVEKLAYALGARVSLTEEAARA